MTPQQSRPPIIDIGLAPRFPEFGEEPFCLCERSRPPLLQRNRKRYPRNRASPVIDAGQTILGPLALTCILRPRVRWNAQETSHFRPLIAYTADMTHADSLPPSEAVEAAIARVLDAERAARDSIGGTQNKAAAKVEAARLAMRGLSDRTERRIRWLGDAFERRIVVDVEALDTHAAALESRHASSSDEIARVERAVRALARELTGGAS